MSTVDTLLPTTVALGAEGAINAILSDIPLFCEGIMGIGVFTCLFTIKQVKIFSIFLYGSSFLAFAAATLDLGQVIIRGPQNSSKVTISLDTISGLIYAREILLSISILSLDLFFWYFVALCPRGERADKSNELATNSKSRLLSVHSASWNRWGIVGTVLKYGSLAALLSVPLLSLLWRLMPGQRKYASIYVVEATIQTSLMAIFILKLLLNVSISPRNNSWHALRAYIVPVSSLLIGLALGISNLVLFAFTETILGRFLHAVEVYLLVVHNLFITFQDSQKRVDVQTNMASIVAPPEKSDYNILPLAYSGKGHPSPSAPLDLSSPGLKRQSEGTLRQSSLSWILPPRRAPSPPEIQTQKRQAEIVLTNKEAMQTASRSEDDNFLNMSSPKLEGPMRRSIEQPQEGSERPTTTISLSYYAMDYGPSAAAEKDDISQSSNLSNPSIALFKADDQHEARDLNSRPSSLDEILRQQSELDQSIAALRLASMSIPNDSPFDVLVSDNATSTTSSKSAALDQSRSTVVNSKTESLSNRSDFSLSVFPVPPMIVNSGIAIEHSSEAHEQGNKSRKGREKTAHSISLTVDTEAPRSLVEPQIDSPVVQYDVTSFIGDLSEPSRSSQVVVLSEDLSADLEDTLTISSAQISPASGLRPMILASLVLAAPSSPIKYNFEERTSLNSVSGTGLPLRPLLLGNPSAQAMPQRMPFTKVPLAQRRQRGGTISSNTRPAISSPRLMQDKKDGVPGTLERPRPPLLRLDNEA